MTDPAEAGAICLEKSGHMGWLNCPVHNREVMERVTGHIGACGHPLTNDSPAWLKAEVARLQSQVAAMQAVIEAARVFVNAPHCCRPVASFGHEACLSDGAPCDLHRWHELRYVLNRYDQPASEDATRV